MLRSFVFISIMAIASPARTALNEPPGGAALPASEIILRSVEAMGGFETFAKLREASIARTLSVGTALRPREIATVQRVRFPHWMQMRVSSDDGRTIFQYDGMRVTAGADANAMSPAAADMRDWFRGFYWREWWVIYARFTWHGLGEVYLGALAPQLENGRTYYVIQVSPRDVSSYELYIDSKTWRPAKRVFHADGKIIVDEYSNFERHGGILFPMTNHSSVDGKLSETIRYSSVAFEFDKAPLSLDRRLDAILTAAKDRKRIPGMVANIDKSGQSLFRKAYGVESVEHSLPATMDTVFPLASVSKLFAGTIAMRLVDNGQLDLDASIRDYLEYVPASHGNVTARHLLNHSHGIAEVHKDLPGPAGPISDTELGDRQSRMRKAFSMPLQFHPGYGWAYSGIGYEVLQAILEQVSGKDYETLANQEIFEPLNLTSATFGGSERLIPGRAAMDYGWAEDHLAYNYLNYTPDNYAAAGLNAAAGDVITFYRGVINGALLSRDTRDEMWREVILDSGEPTDYALGWGSYVRPRDGLWSVGHSGGGSSWTRYFPDDDITVVVLSNLNGARADALVYDLASAVRQDRLLNP